MDSEILYLYNFTLLSSFFFQVYSCFLSVFLLVFPLFLLFQSYFQSYFNLILVFSLDTLHSYGFLLRLIFAEPGIKHQNKDKSKSNTKRPKERKEFKSNATAKKSNAQEIKDRSYPRKLYTKYESDPWVFILVIIILSLTLGNSQKQGKNHFGYVFIFNLYFLKKKDN